VYILFPLLLFSYFPFYFQILLFKPNLSSKFEYNCNNTRPPTWYAYFYIYLFYFIIIIFFYQFWALHILAQDGDILAQVSIELIEYPYQQGASSFSEAYLERTSKLSMLGLEQFGMGDRPKSFLECAWVRTKCAQNTRIGLCGQYMTLESCQE
jgi:hypothetical protein